MLSALFSLSRTSSRSCGVFCVGPWEPLQPGAEDRACDLRAESDCPATPQKPTHRCRPSRAEFTTPQALGHHPSSAVGCAPDEGSRVDTDGVLVWRLVFISCGCCKKLPHTGWLEKKTKFFCHNSRGHKSKIKCQEDRTRAKHSGGESVLGPLASGGRWRSWACDHPAPVSASTATVPLPLLSPCFL